MIKLFSHNIELIVFGGVILQWSTMYVAGQVKRGDGSVQSAKSAVLGATTPAYPFSSRA